MTMLPNKAELERQFWQTVEGLLMNHFNHRLDVACEGD